jgi:DNA-binding response OmpR family regulator
LVDSLESIGAGCILVVEDDEPAREKLRTALESAGYAVALTGNGREALSIVFGEGPPDIRLLLSDFDIPDFSGVEIVGVLASYSRSAQIPIIVLSCLPESSALQLKIRAWVEKPFEIEALLALVRKHASPLPIS